MPISIDTYGFRKNAISRELQDRLTSGACTACGSNSTAENDFLCKECVVQLADKGEGILSPEVASYLKGKVGRWGEGENLLGLRGWAKSMLKEEGYKKQQHEDMEVLTNPKEIEEKYRQVGEDEWEFEREGPVGTDTMEKLYPGWMNSGRQYDPKSEPEYSDWLEKKELGGKKKPKDEETYLTPVEPVESQLSVRHKTAGLTTEQERAMVEEHLEKKKREKSEWEIKEQKDKERLRSQRRRDDETIEEGEREGLVLKPGAMCTNHNDIPATFVLQTEILKQSGMPRRMPLCSFCAFKLNVIDLPPSEGQMCTNAEHHVENPKSSPIAMKMFVHDGVIDKNAPPLPLCKDCASPFAIRLRPLNEEGERDKDRVPLARSFDERKKGKAHVLNQLMKLANYLDSRGLHAEANEIDAIFRKEAAKSDFIRALKDDNAEAAHRSLVGMSGKDFGLADQEFRELTDLINSAVQSAGSPDSNYDMEDARKMLGVGKNINTNTNMTHNPVTGKPYSTPMPKGFCPECGKKLVMRYPGGDPEDGPARLRCPQGHREAEPCEICPHYFHDNECKEAGCNCYSSFGTKEDLDEMDRQYKEMYEEEDIDPYQLRGNP